MKTNFCFLLLALFAFHSCEEPFFEAPPANDPVTNFENLWQTFHEKYAVFEQRGVDWNELYTIYRPQISDASSDAELFTVITEMLSHLDDGHVSLMATDRPFWSGHREFRERTEDLLFNLYVVKNHYVQGHLKNINDQYFYGKLKGEIGYLYIHRLNGDKPAFIDDFIRENQNSKGIIIDLRHNNGGDFTNGEVIASRFAGKRTLAFSAQPKNGPGPDDFGEIVDYYLEAKGAMQFTKPVVVITNGYTISAGENLALYLRTLPQVTIVGDNTTGAMGERIEKEMPNGWIYSITAQIITAADGQVYEGPGIPPDVWSLNTETDLSNNIDRMLEKAIAEIGE